MKLFLLSALFFPLFIKAQTKDSAQIGDLNRRWIAAYATRDTTTMEEILAPDFVMVSPKGMKLSKRDVVSNVGNKEINIIAEIDSSSVRVFGNTAVVVGYTRFTFKTKEGESTGTNCYSDVYVKRRGRWQAVAAHVTLLTSK